MKIYLPVYNDEHKSIKYILLTEINDNLANSLQLADQLNVDGNNDGVLVYELVDKLPNVKDKYLVINGCNVSYHEFLNGINNEGFTNVFLSWYSKSEAEILLKNSISLPVMQCMLYIISKLEIEVSIEDINSINSAIPRVIEKLNTIDNSKFIDLLKDSENILMSSEMYKSKKITEIINNQRALVKFDNNNMKDVTSFARHYMLKLFEYNYNGGRILSENSNIKWPKIKEYFGTIGISIPEDRTPLIKKPIKFKQGEDCTLNQELNSIRISFLLEQCADNNHYISTKLPIPNFLIKFIRHSAYFKNADVTLPKLPYTELIKDSYGVYKSNKAPLYAITDDDLDEDTRLNYLNNGVDFTLSNLNNTDKVSMFINLCKSICNGLIFDLFIFTNKCIKYREDEINDFADYEANSSNFYNDTVYSYNFKNKFINTKNYLI